MLLGNFSGELVCTGGLSFASEGAVRALKHQARAVGADELGAAARPEAPLLDQLD